MKCSLSSNNILNPATPYGDCSLVRMANLYANVLQLDRPAQLRECFDMLTERSARLLNLVRWHAPELLRQELLMGSPPARGPRR